MKPGDELDIMARSLLHLLLLDSSAYLIYRAARALIARPRQRVLSAASVAAWLFNQPCMPAADEGCLSINQ